MPMPIISLSALLVGSNLLLPIADTYAPSPVRIVAHIRFCQLQTEAESRANLPEVCRDEEIIPADGHEAVSIMECTRGLMMFAASFQYEGREWRTKGGTCEEESSAFLEWRLKEAAKIKP